MQKFKNLLFALQGNEVGVVDEDEEHLEYGPSEWLAGVFPKSTRYFPQIGDELIYYRDGHQAYLEQVEKERLYYLRSEWKSDIPYIKMPQLKASHFYYQAHFHFVISLCIL